MVSVLLLIGLIISIYWILYTNKLIPGEFENCKDPHLRVGAQRKIARSFCAVMLFLTIISQFISIKPGEVGVVVDLLGDSKGVESRELTVGLHWIAPWKNVYTFPIFEQNHSWEGVNGFNFQTSEGLSVHADIGINFHLDGEKIHILFCKYRKGMEEITDVFIKNIIRDAVNRVSATMVIEELYSTKKEEFFSKVQAMVTAELEPLGFIISHVFVIGKLIVPEIVMDALDNKIAATQRAQQRENELRETEAQARKDIATAEGVGKSKIIAAKADAESLIIEATSKAEANTLLNRSLTGELLKWQAINKWNGILPTTMTGEGASFIVDLKK